MTAKQKPRLYLTDPPRDLRPDGAILAIYLRRARASLADPGWRHPESMYMSSVIERAIAHAVKAAHPYRKASKYRETSWVLSLRRWHTAHALSVVWDAIRAHDDPALVAACTDSFGILRLEEWTPKKSHAEVLAVLDAAIQALEPDGRP